MKIKLLLLFASGILLVVLLLIDLRSGNDKTTDKWASFGLGMMAPIFVSSIIAAVLEYRKQKAL